MPSTSVLRARHGECGHRPAHALELDLADGLGLEAVLDRGMQPLRDEDLPRGGAARETRRHDRDVPDGGVVVPPLVADASKRRVADRRAKAEAELVALLLP